MPLLETILICVIPGVLGSAFLKKYFKCHLKAASSNSVFTASEVVDRIDVVDDIDQILDRIRRFGPNYLEQSDYSLDALVDAVEDRLGDLCDHVASTASQQQTSRALVLYRPYASSGNANNVPNKVGARQRRKRRAQASRKTAYMDLAMAIGRRARIEFGFNTRSEANYLVARRWIRDYIIDSKKILK